LRVAKLEKVVSLSITSIFNIDMSWSGATSEERPVEIK
jgi:hypothetical protein